MKAVCFPLLALVAAGCAADDIGQRSFESNYPPDYPVCHIDETASSGPFEVIRHNTNWGSGYGMTIAYRGVLRDTHADEDIEIYVRLNGKDALVSAAAGTHDDAYVRLWAGPRDCWYCAGYPGQDCPNGVGWTCDWPNEVETSLFEWAKRPAALNAWDVEVAAHAGDEWDSDFGNNYRLRFEERYQCSE